MQYDELDASIQSVNYLDLRIDHLPQQEFYLKGLNQFVDSKEMQTMTKFYKDKIVVEQRRIYKRVQLLKQRESGLTRSVFVKPKE